MKLVQFGAGNVGRSFIGQLFARAGWEVVFVDIDERIIDELNRRGQYRVEIRDRTPGTIVVSGVRGVSGRDTAGVIDEICGADLVATAVGKKALPHIMASIAAGLKRRAETLGKRPLDIVICENMLDGARFFREGLEEHLPPGFPLPELVGLVETSIGKMVPIMSEHDRADDPLLVFAEAYNTLIVDRRGFRGPVPEVPGIDAMENIGAYVNRKLFIHNMGHAVLGYVSHLFRPDYLYVWEAAQDEEILRCTREAMWESGKALIERYTDEFDVESIDDHIEDLLLRFQNRALGDTIYRVGRDLYRKLGPDDRLVGALNLCLDHGIIPSRIALAIACSFFFRGVDDEGAMYENDRIFHEVEVSQGLNHILKEVCGIEDVRAVRLIEGYFVAIAGGNRDLGSDVFH
jgi:mannitol-1-phosphate 5-dehydrogenase